MKQLKKLKKNSEIIIYKLNKKDSDLKFSEELDKFYKKLSDFRRIEEIKQLIFAHPDYPKGEAHVCYNINDAIKFKNRVIKEIVDIDIF